MTDLPAFPDPKHDHSRCVAAAIGAAERACAERGVRLTALRRRVLELVWTSHGPVGAYALLERLRGDGQAAAPPTVYRALDFLIEQGLVHRIARLNAFVGCVHPGIHHAGHFLICSGCGAAVELDDAAIDAAIAIAAGRLGFVVERQTVEVEGLCPACRAASGGSGES